MCIRRCSLQYLGAVELGGAAVDDTLRPQRAPRRFNSSQCCGDRLGPLAGWALVERERAMVNTVNYATRHSERRADVLRAKVSYCATGHGTSTHSDADDLRFIRVNASKQQGISQPVVRGLTGIVPKRAGTRGWISALNVETASCLSSS